MTTPVYRNADLRSRARRAIERFEIHDATCRYKRQGLCCSTCSELYERACRAYAAARLEEVA